MGKSAQVNGEWDRTKRAYLETTGGRLGTSLTLDARRSSRWGRSPRGPFVILGAEELLAGRWWFGLSEKRFSDAGVSGVILLCRKGEQLLDFGLPAARLRPLLPHLSLEGTRGERKLNVQQVGSRYLLRVPGRQDLDLDITEARGELSWLGVPSPETDRHPPVKSSTNVRTEKEAAASVDPPVAFFARVRNRVLEPLDDPGLEDGTMVLVTAARADKVPASSAMRRIVARGGPESLPGDLSERHDIYARPSGRS